MEKGHYGQYTGNAKHSRKEEMIHDRELIYDAKKQLHRADQDYKSDSPAKKALVGNQDKLPGHLKQAISDAPGKMYGKKKGAAAYMSDELTDMPLDKDMTGGRSAAMMYGKKEVPAKNMGKVLKGKLRK